jgi:hypothetical protein
VRHVLEIAMFANIDGDARVCQSSKELFDGRTPNTEMHVASLRTLSIQDVSWSLSSPIFVIATHKKKLWLVAVSVRCEDSKTRLEMRAPENDQN